MNAKLTKNEIVVVGEEGVWEILTTSSTKSLMAVMPSTKSKGTRVVYHARVVI